MRSVRSLVVAGLVVVVLAVPAVVLADGRVALVVGNSTYAHIGRLPNPDNDARDMSVSLRRLGFEVTTEFNVDRVELTEALRAFTRRSAGADVSLVFYAGHGIEMDGVNYAGGQNNLGVMYSRGRGVRKDDSEAVRWYRRAAEQGHALGQFNLGNMYRDGRGVARDYQAAVTWFRRAADQPGCYVPRWSRRATGLRRGRHLDPPRRRTERGLRAEHPRGSVSRRPWRTARP